MIFADRRQAGDLLAKKLLRDRVVADIVVGLAHGGVVISSVVAKTLGIPNAALIVKKIGMPGNPELAIGAVVPAGQTVAVQGKRVLIVDDGIATGETMKAAVAWVKDHGASSVIVAVPVAPPDVVIAANRYIRLQTPGGFGAIGAYYKKFPQLSDADMVQYLS